MEPSALRNVVPKPRQECSDTSKGQPRSYGAALFLIHAWNRPGDGGLSTWQGIDIVVGVTVS